jgi:esterase/lipase
MNHSVWELNTLIPKHPESSNLRGDLLKFFHENRVYLERKKGVPEEDRSFLLQQDRDAPCCLLIHGAGGTPAEMRPLGRHLFDAGYTVYGMSLALLAEHAGGAAVKPGREKLSLRRIRDRGGLQEAYSPDRSLSDAEVVLKAILTVTPRTYLVGFSFGGTIALRLMRRQHVRGAILLAPGLYPMTRGKVAAFSVLKRLAPFAAKQVSPLEFRLGEFIERTRALLKPIEQPVLVVQAARDNILSTKGVALLKKLAKNPRSKFVVLDSARHVIVKGEDSQQVFRLCVDFLRET